MSKPEEEDVGVDLSPKQSPPKNNGLSFFTADDNDSSSDSESDAEGSKTEAKLTNNESSELCAVKNKLPSPSTLFATVGKPKFLDRPLEEEGVDWNSLSKRYEPLFEYSSVSCPGSETVDLTSAERSEATISGAPVKYKTEISETKRHLFLHGKRSADLASAISGMLASSPDGETNSKKQKPP